MGRYVAWGSILCACWGAVAGQSMQAEGASPGTYQEIMRQAEAKTAAREWSAAAALWQELTSLNPVQGTVWARLGEAQYNAKDYSGAIRAYEKVIDLGWGTPANSAYNIACCYALLSKREPALNWLEKAFNMGYRFLEHAQTDRDLRPLHDSERFRRIVGLVDTSAMSRVQGWRYDLGLLAREVKRRGYSPFRELSPREFDASVRRLHDAIPKLADLEIIVAMMKLLRKVGDGHTGLLFPNQRPEYLQSLPLQFYLFKEGLYVIAADPKYRSLLGSQVLRFGDRTVQEVWQALDPLVSRDNEIWPTQRVPYMMRSLPLLKGLGLIPDLTKASLTIRDQRGETQTVLLEADASQPNIWNILPNPATWVNLPQTVPGPVPLYLKNMSSSYWFEYLPDAKLVYFQFNVIRNGPGEPLSRFFDRLFGFIDEHEVEKLVIDLRWNNGGNTFLSQPLIHGLIRNQKVNQRGKLFVIIGRRTFSAAQNTATFIERHTNATFVGEPTGSRPNFVGEEVFFTLPYSKLRANVSDLFWQSSWPGDQRTWIAPQLYAPPTFAAYRSNRDPALEAILADRPHDEPISQPVEGCALR
jgi:tetratricopeptide (TPR) repeat protein